MSPPIFLIGEAYGEYEAKIGKPFVGPSGAFLLRLLHDAKLIELTEGDRYLLNRAYETNDGGYIDRVWLGHRELYRTNVFNQHPPGNELGFFCGSKGDSLPGWPALLSGTKGHVRAEFEPELDRLAYELLSHNPNLCICLGNAALWALAGRTGIKKWRGSTLASTHTVAEFKLLPIYHPAYVIRDYATRPIAIADLKKAKREACFPDLRRPQRDIWIEPSIRDINEFITNHITPDRILSVDIETSGSRITCIGLGYSDIAIVIPFDDERAKGRSYWPTIEAERACWGLVEHVLSDPTIPKLFQNGLYDIAFLWRSMRIKVLGAAEDTMLLHHTLQPEMEKSLAFLGSVYSDEGTWKHMGKRAKTIKRDA